MYNLHLSPEQLEIRDTVRDFVTREIKPVALKAERLDVCDRSLLMAQIDAASQLGLRTLALSEDRAMNDAQRDALLPKFLGGDRYHLAFAGHEGGTDTRLGVNYHRPMAAAAAVKTSAVKSGGDFIVNGVKNCVANAPVAALFAVLVNICLLY